MFKNDFMLFRQRLSRLGILMTILGIAGCVVEQPRPIPPPKTTPPSQIPPPVQVPVTPTPSPKIYSGSYSERLEAAARDAVAGTSTSVQRNANTIKLTIPASVAFAANSAQPLSRISVVLDNVGRLGREYNKSTIFVKGFTDSTGSFEHNQELSEQRAQSIGAILSRDIAAARIHTAGYGPRYPIADNKTDAGRIQNRRIEIDMVITP